MPGAMLDSSIKLLLKIIISGRRDSGEEALAAVVGHSRRRGLMRDASPMLPLSVPRRVSPSLLQLHFISFFPFLASEAVSDCQRLPQSKRSQRRIR